jgi:hypothetical protein
LKCYSELRKESGNIMESRDDLDIMKASLRLKVKSSKGKGAT